MPDYLSVPTLQKKQRYALTFVVRRLTCSQDGHRGIRLAFGADWLGANEEFT